MRTISNIKEYCVQLDLTNNLGSEKDIRYFYDNIEPLRLLEIYSNYNGLKCYKTEEPRDYIESYSIDILTIIDLFS